MKRYLILQNGRVFEGEAIGAEGETVGELVFNTGMCGYTETLTDESYAGQIVMQTFPLIGNYGINAGDAEGEPALKGYITGECCQNPSNFRCQQTLDGFLRQHGIPGMCCPDIREITCIIRESGVMNAKISNFLQADADEISAYTVKDAVKSVTCKQITSFPGGGKHVVLYDFGYKHNIQRILSKLGCAVTVVPADTTAKQVLALKPDGVMLSNGPGDPAENTQIIAQLKLLIGQCPVFGICLGHQLMALAMGGKTTKLHYGHRGVNQPVRDLTTGRVYITSQNHGYAVCGEVPGGTLRYANANDGTCEGIDYPALNAFSVQFHPEACSGPKDTEFIFNRFIELMEGK